MRVKFWQSADEHERYMPHAFDRIIGQTVPFTYKAGEGSPGHPTGRMATVIAVEVAEDGSGAEWTVEVIPEEAS